MDAHNLFGINAFRTLSIAMGVYTPSPSLTQTQSETDNS
jgi:hypothetical protein